MNILSLERTVWHISSTGDFPKDWSTQGAWSKGKGRKGTREYAHMGEREQEWDKGVLMSSWKREIKCIQHQKWNNNNNKKIGLKNQTAVLEQG